MFGKRFSRALAVTTVGTLIMASAAFADEVWGDGDGVAPVSENALALGAACIGEDKSGDALIAIRRQANTNSGNVFTGGSTVALAATGSSGLTVAFEAGNTVTLPSNWATLMTGPISDAKSLTVTLNSATAGPFSGTITLTATGTNADDGEQLVRTNTMSVSADLSDCVPANTAPSVAVSGVAAGADYEIGSVPPAMCDVTDTEDGNSSFAATLSTITGSESTYGLGSQTASCSYTDGGDLTDTDSVTYNIVDTGKPVITDLGATLPPNGSDDWYTSAVTNTFRATDSGAGFLMPLTNPHEFTESSGTAEGFAVTISSGTVTDVAGNIADAIDSAAFKIDLGDPTGVAFIGGPAAASSHYFGSVPSVPTCTANDAVSGLAGCVVTGYSTAVGSHTMTATATDNAGRTATIQSAYTVLAWTATGFYRPVDMGATLNIVKGGATVPLKFNVYAATELTETSAIKGFNALEIDCGALNWVPADEVEITSTGGTSLRYDSTDGQFIQNWKVPNTKNKCYAAVVSFQDGTSIHAYFKTR